MIQSLPSGSRQYVSNHLTTDNRALPPLALVSFLYVRLIRGPVSTAIRHKKAPKLITAPQASQQGAKPSALADIDLRKLRNQHGFRPSILRRKVVRARHYALRGDEPAAEPDFRRWLEWIAHADRMLPRPATPRGWSQLRSLALTTTSLARALGLVLSAASRSAERAAPCHVQNIQAGRAWSPHMK